VLEYTSVEEASEYAGFHIPKPSDEFPLANGRTYLRQLPGQPDYLSASHYTYVPLAPTSISLEVGLAHHWRGEETWTRGQPTLIGDRSGYRIEEDGAYYFAFRCGDANGGGLWCVVRGSDEVPAEAYERLVRSLR
jgi:hypothetical protein